MITKRKYSENEDEHFSFWQSYSDLMAALLLMFVLIVAGFLLQVMILNQDKEKEEAEANSKIAEDAYRLNVLQGELEIREMEIENQKNLLDDQQKMIEKFIGLKEEIIVNLKEEFEKTDLKVNVDPNTGSIRFDSNILFESGSFEITDNGKLFLDNFIPVYFGALLNSKYADNISEIIIEGHTDTKGEYMFNLELSQKRALSVCEYCLNKIVEDNMFDIKEIRRIITANGRSWSVPKYNDDGSINMDESRRVEVKFRLQDDEMINEMKGILENE